jgi:hypothetical protein
MSTFTEKDRAMKVVDTFNLLNTILEEAIAVRYDGKGKPAIILKQDRNELLRKVKPLFLKLKELGAPVPEHYVRKFEQIGRTETDPVQD